MGEKKPLAVEDQVAGFQMQALVAQAAAQLEAAQQAMAVWLDNIRYRYSAPEADGWQLERWTDGFVRTEREGNHGTEDN